MRTTTFVPVLLTLFAPLTAQTVGVSLTALTPLSAQVNDGTASASTTFPAGPLAAFGGFNAVLPGAVPGAASVGWSSLQHSTAASVSLQHTLLNNGSWPAFQGSVGPHEFLITFTATAPTPTTLRLFRQSDLTAGEAWPTIQVDIDNDGSFDQADLPIGQVQYTTTVGPQPLLVRIRIDAALASGTLSASSVALVLEPQNDLTIWTPVTSCYNTAPPPPPFLRPSFDDTGVDLTIGQLPTAPSVMVLGLSAQPLLLPNTLGLLCLLLPSPDILLFEPSGQYHLPLPASVRPVQFYAQGVTLTAFGLLSTDGYAVSAM